MVYDYIITLKTADPKTADIISQFLYFIAVSCFLYFAFYPRGINMFYLVSALVILVCWLWLFIKRKKTGRAYFTAGLAIAAIVFFSGFHANWLIGLLYLLGAVAERELKFPKEIGFSADEIVINSLFKKRYNWHDVKNAMINEGIVTLDFKNNKLIQKETAENVPHETEAEFNAFCRERLKGESLEFKV